MKAAISDGLTVGCAVSATGEGFHTAGDTQIQNWLGYKEKAGRVTWRDLKLCCVQATRHAISFHKAIIHCFLFNLYSFLP